MTTTMLPTDPPGAPASRRPAIVLLVAALLLFGAITPAAVALWSCLPATGPSCTDAFPRAFALVGVSLGLIAVGTALALIPHLLRRRARAADATADEHEPPPS